MAGSVAAFAGKENMLDMFELGDVVRLKSGGPSMTVVGKREGYLLCMWYVEEEHAMSSTDFIPECLVHVENKEK